MRFGERFRATVGVIVAEKEHSNDLEPVATFFLVQNDRSRWFGNAVEAEHQIRLVTTRHGLHYMVDANHRIAARMLAQSGEVVEWPLAPDLWSFGSGSCQPDDPGVDIAIHSGDIPRADELLALPVEFDAARHVRTAAELQDRSDPNEITVELGQPLYYAGIFTSARATRDRPIAVIRSATLAAANQTDVRWSVEHEDERLNASFSAETTHLIDTRSRAGFSGSPCFVQWVLPRAAEADHHEWPPFWRELVETQGSEDPRSFGWNHTLTMWFGMFAAFNRDFGIGMVVPASAVQAALDGTW